MAHACGQAACTHPFFGDRAMLCAEQPVQEAPVAKKRKRKGKLCKSPGCKTHPAYGPEGGKRAWCLEHKEAIHVNVVSKLCKSPGCTTQPNYGAEGGKPEWCLEHKEAIHVNVVNKRCKSPGCTTQPTYGPEGGKAAWCLQHKEAIHVDVVNKLCKSPGCTTRPTYGPEGGKAAWCLQHKEAIHVDVVSKRCKSPGCKTHPSYGPEGGKPAWCLEHKEAIHVDVIIKRCKSRGCTTQPAYGPEGGKPAWCVQHKEAIHVNVMSKLCKSPGCTTTAWYGRPGLPATACAQHRTIGMIAFPTSRCRRPNCKNLAIWGHNFEPLNCELHKQEDQQNLVERPCISCHLKSVLDRSDLCENCGVWDKVKFVKQNALMSYLDACGFEGVSTDRIVDGGECGKERPDRVFYFGHKVVIVECDEHQHTNTPETCEKARMVNLGQMYGGAPVYFLRFNPDKYNTGDEAVRVRHEMVVAILRDIQDGRMELPEALTSALYLYYDGWQGLHREEWRVFMPYETMKE